MTVGRAGRRLSMRGAIVPRPGTAWAKEAPMRAVRKVLGPLIPLMFGTSAARAAAWERSSPRLPGLSRGL